MGKKIKSFATLLVALSTAFSVAMLVSCSGDNTADPEEPTTTTPEVTKTLSSIAVTNLPIKTEFFVGDTFIHTGLEVTATYSDESTAVVTGYTVETPDMSTAGLKDVVISYTESSVTVETSYQINVEADSYMSISIDSSWAPQIGVEVASLNPTVNGQSRSGNQGTLSSDEYTISVTYEDGGEVTETYVQGETTYRVTVTLNDDESVTDSKTYTTSSATSFKYEAEDAEVEGLEVLPNGHTDSNFSWDASRASGLVYSSTGNNLLLGSITFTVYALEGTYDLSWNVSCTAIIDTVIEDNPNADYESWQLREGTPTENYVQIPYAVNDRVDLDVNGTNVEIPDTSIFTPEVSTSSYRGVINTWKVIDVANVSLQNGANTLTFTFGESKNNIGTRSGWANGGPTFNVDYIQFDAGEPDGSKTIESIELETEPYVQTYNMVSDNEDVKLDTSGMLIKVNYTDTTSAYVCSNFTTSYDFTTPGTKTVTVTYGGASTSYEVTVRGDPDSISIDDSFTLSAGDDLSSLDLTVNATYDQTTTVLDSSLYEVTVTDGNGGEVTETTAVFGKTYIITVTYELSDGSGNLTDSITRTANMVLNAEDATYSSSGSTTHGTRSNDISNTYVYFDLKSGDSGNITFTFTLEEANTYNFSMEMYNANIFTVGSYNYVPSELDLSKVLDIEVNDSGSLLDIDGVVMSTYENTSNSQYSMFFETNKQLMDFGDVALVEGENKISIDVKFDESQQNKWSGVYFGIDTCIISSSTTVVE